MLNDVCWRLFCWLSFLSFLSFFRSFVRSYLRLSATVSIVVCCLCVFAALCCLLVSCRLVVWNGARM